ncbi:MAG TPA: trypsin-like peptidase domain-containing protein [Acidimicrobiales bacterium]|nr:trypsin-like peptidase domain-containing protein [Acidimicrobiales bacterium]
MPYGMPHYGPPPAYRPRRRTGPAIAAVLVAGTVAASAVVSHTLWPSSTRAAATSTPSSGTSPSSGSSGSFGGSSSSTDPFGSSGGTGSGASSSEGTGGPSDVSSIAAKVSPALVIIDTTLQYQQAQGAGTGIVLTSNGEILTNNHVIDGATSIRVTDVGNGQTYTAKVVGYDKSDDVAVLQLVDASGLKTASIASSSSKVGDQVVAVGNAGGTGSLTPAGGTVTALNQAITASDELDGTAENLTGLIETNADVQSGDSGGSLVNTSGQVIGIDTAAAQGYSLQSAYGTSSQGYAIPISKALSIVNAIESGQSSTNVHIGSTAFLGVMIESAGSSSGSAYGSYGGSGSYGNYSNGNSSSTSGAEIANVVSGGAAADAGLAQGDVITAINGSSISTPSDLSKAVLGFQSGQTIQVTYTDTSGTSHTTSVTLQDGPPA